jgi:hypothetical protein
MYSNNISIKVLYKNSDDACIPLSKKEIGSYIRTLANTNGRQILKHVDSIVLTDYQHFENILNSKTALQGKVSGIYLQSRVKDKSGTIKSWLRQTKTLLMFSSQTPGDGLEAITEYKVLKNNKRFSMLQIQLKTGRKNQIRVHMKDIGHSVAGDKKYGATSNPVKRLGLHACQLTLIHPFSDQTLSFSAQIPDSFNACFR